MNRTIGRTKIPTATCAGRKGYVFNPVIGCNRYKNGKCGAAGFTCWAAAYMRRYWKQWFWWEIEVEVNFLGEDFKWSKAYTDLIGRLEKFKPTFLEFQFMKKFPKKPSIIAVGWMSDIQYWKSEWVEDVLTKIRMDNRDRTEKGLPLHVFQFLTKEPLIYGARLFPEGSWLGFTATTQEEYNQRWWTVNADGAKGEYSIGKTNRKNCKTFVYLEPLKEEIDLGLNKSSIKPDWVIAGGQNGPGAEPVHPNWIRSIRDQCHKYEIPFFFKGWGIWIPANEVSIVDQLKKIEINDSRCHKYPKGAGSIGATRLPKHTRKKYECSFKGKRIKQFPEVPR